MLIGAIHRSNYAQLLQAAGKVGKRITTIPSNEDKDWLNIYSSTPLRVKEMWAEYSKLSKVKG